jgi:indolepyruvate ferredoxin oxidoreductase
MVVTAGAKMLGLMARDRTRVVCNSHEIITGEFTRNTEFSLPGERMELSLTGRLGENAVAFLEATELARVHLGDSIYANVLILGAAWQQGLLPLSHASIMTALELNRAGVKGNKRAFEIGRWAMVDPEAAAASIRREVAALPKTLAEKIDFRAERLVAYQGKRLAKRYRRFVARFADADLQEAVAKSYHKLLSYKDEYEVARLHSETVETLVNEQFEDVKTLKFHLAAPVIARKDKDGKPLKRAFGNWMLGAFGLLKKGKILRGTPFDPFGYSAERKMERALIREFERDMKEVLKLVNRDNLATCVALAELPLKIRGFGHVKLKNAADVAKQREALLAELRNGPTLAQAAE